MKLEKSLAICLVNIPAISSASRQNSERQKQQQKPRTINHVLNAQPFSVHLPIRHASIRTATT